jgi:biopolymer transport protein ExbD
MKLRRAREYRRGRIEIIPMIDVMFFLLVTFMLASLSMQSLHSVPVDLPRGEAVALQPQQPVTLTITKDNQVYLDSKLVTLETLADTLHAMLQKPDADIVVAADNGAAAGMVVQSMIQARRAGVEHFLIAVKHE